MSKNTVELIGFYGSDEIIACSAWTSTSRTLTDEKKARIPALLKQLWTADPVPHGSPFEKGVVHFLVNSDIASHIHKLKHRISSTNAESARYKELKEDKMYLPEDWKGIKVSDESKEYEACAFTGKQTWYEMLEEFSIQSNILYHRCLADLTPVLGRKRAKESARYFKMYNSQIECDIMFNMRSFHNFLTQRMDDHAQLEIQDIARQMLNLVKNIEGNPFEYTLNTWGL
jgi:thymidylate synthase (FAD)